MEVGNEKNPNRRKRETMWEFGLKDKGREKSKELFGWPCMSNRLPSKVYARSTFATFGVVLLAGSPTRVALHRRWSWPTWKYIHIRHVAVVVVGASRRNTSISRRETCPTLESCSTCEKSGVGGKLEFDEVSGIWSLSSLGIVSKFAIDRGDPGPRLCVDCVRKD